MRKLLKSAVLIGAAIGLAFAAPAMAQKRGGILTFGVKAEPPSYDLEGSTSYGTLHFVEQHYSLLLNFDLDNWPALKGDVAESWAGKLQPSVGKVVVTSTARDGRTFYRVRVVGLADRAQAQKVATELQATHRVPPLWVGSE